jgi:hypothetical protein
VHRFDQMTPWAKEIGQTQLDKQSDLNRCLCLILDTDQERFGTIDIRDQMMT